MDIPALANKMLNQSDIVCWPQGGGGNALCRIIEAHDDYLYNSSWNAWGSYLPSSISAPHQFKPVVYERVDKLVPTWGVAHYSTIWSTLPRWFDTNTTIIEALSSSLQESLKSDSNRHWLKQWFKDSYRVQLPMYNHYSAAQLVKETTRPIVQLCYSDDHTILKRRIPDIVKLYNNLDYIECYEDCIAQHHWDKRIDHPQVLNIPIEKLFYSSYDDFLICYTQLRAHFSITQDLSEACWAFVLYYRDRVERGSKKDA